MIRTIGTLLILSTTTSIGVAEEADRFKDWYVGVAGNDAGQWEVTLAKKQWLARHNAADLCSYKSDRACTRTITAQGFDSLLVRGIVCSTDDRADFILSSTNRGEERLTELSNGKAFALSYSKRDCKEVITLDVYGALDAVLLRDSFYGGSPFDPDPVEEGWYD